MDVKADDFFKDVQHFDSQVAGHKSKDEPGSSGILKHKDGYLLKPTKILLGDVEISFYQRLQQDATLLPFKKFTPQYYGYLCFKSNDRDIKYLKMKDVTEGFVKPCVMDVKIGKQTWEPNAAMEKRRSEDVKYAISKKELGFCIPGYHVHNILSGELIKFGKEEGKRLNKGTTFEAFKQFLNYPQAGSFLVLQHFVNQLGELLEWWSSQRVIHLYASSILLVYDAEKLEKLASKSLEEGDLAANDFWAKVYVIDFAHVVPANGLKDFNYISGLSNLINLLKSIM